MGTPARGTPPLKLLLDEMLAPQIAAQLRSRGWDVEAIQVDHAELIGLDDWTVLAEATQMGRVLVTDNVRHFMPIHER